MPDWMSKERIDLIRSLGARINLVSKEQGGSWVASEAPRSWRPGPRERFYRASSQTRTTLPAHAATTGPEIWWQLRFRGMKPDAFIAGVGTGGTIMGAGSFLKQMNPKIKLHPLEPASSPTLSTGHKVGKHRIQGISDEFIPAIVDLKALDEIVAVDDGDAILMAQKLATEIGLGVGISSGANFIGAVKVREMMGDDAVVVTVLADDNKKYLSTDLLGEEPVKDGFLSSEIKLECYFAFKRVCETCCNPDECDSVRSEQYEEERCLPRCVRRT